FLTDRLPRGGGRHGLWRKSPGAGGSVAARAAADAEPDGSSLYQPVLSTFVSLRPAAANVPLHVPKDFLPIGFVTENPTFIAVSPTLGISTLPQLIELAKQRPGKLTFAATGVGRLTHLAGELLQHEAGIKLLLVPYTGGPNHAINDVTTGRVSMIIEGYSGIAGAAQSGSVKLIAVASPRRLAQFPDLPTVAEPIPGFRATGWAVLVAPVGTPEAVIKKVSDDLRKVTAEPELQAKLAKLGSYTNPMSAAEVTAFVHQQQQTWQPVVDEIAKKQKQKQEGG